MRTLLVGLVAAATLAAAPVPKDLGSAFARKYGKAYRIDPACEISEKRGELRIVTNRGGMYGFTQANEFWMPHTTKPVTGDFTATVTVTPLNFPAQGIQESNIYQAGLHLLSDEKTSLLWTIRRIQVPGFYQTAGVCECRMKNGSSSSPDGDEVYTKVTVRLRMERRGEMVSVFVSKAGGEWTKVTTQRLDLKRTVEVGLHVGSTNKPYGATFADFDVKEK